MVPPSLSTNRNREYEYCQFDPHVTNVGEQVAEPDLEPACQLWQRFPLGRLAVTFAKKD
jgi:hypothetical protein